MGLLLLLTLLPLVCYLVLPVQAYFNEHAENTQLIRVGLLVTLNRARVK